MIIHNRNQTFRKSNELARASKTRGESGLTRKRRVDRFEGLVDLLTDFGTSKDDLAAYEDQQHNLWLDHSVDETWEQLRLVGAEVMMLGRKTLQTDGELDVTRANDVLNLEVGELGTEAEFLDDPSILARSELRIIFRLCTSDDHLA